MFKAKKGQTLNGAYSVVLMIIMVGILLGVGLYAMAQTNTALTTTHTVTLERIVPTTVGTAVSHATDCGFNTFAVTTVQGWNTTDLLTLGSGNYTYDASAGTVSNLTSYFTDSYNVTYTFKGSENGADENYCDAFDTSISGLGDFADWIAIIVLVIAAGIVLGIVLNSFSGNKGI